MGVVLPGEADAAEHLDAVLGDGDERVRHQARQRELIEDLLDIARLDGNALPMAPRSFDVCTFLTDGCEMLRGLAEELTPRIRGLVDQMVGRLPPGIAGG